MIHRGDCLTVMQTMEPESVDAIVCDPPYGLEFMGKEWDNLGRKRALRGETSGLPTGPGSGRGTSPTAGRPGFDLSRAAQSAMQGWHYDWAVEALRIAKPGAHLLAFGGTRTSHRLVCAIEDAGWEIRDSLCWLFGSGFPKSKNVGNGFGTALKPGHEPIILARKPLIGTVAANVTLHGTGALNVDGCRIGTSDTMHRPGPNGGPGGNAWREAEGRADRMPVAFEQHNGGRWPANVVLSHTPDCREVGTRKVKGSTGGTSGHNAFGQDAGWNAHKNRPTEITRPVDADGMETVTAWECVSGCPVRMLDEQSGSLKSRGNTSPERQGSSDGQTVYGKYGHRIVPPNAGDVGGASRFFYCAKSSRAEREVGLDGMPEREGCHRMNDSVWKVDARHPNGGYMTAAQSKGGNHHPTVKPIALMRWLCRLITPPNGLILDPFCGSGTTGCAAALEGFRFVGIESDAEYCAIAEKRIAHCRQQPSLWDVA